MGTGFLIIGGIFSVVLALFVCLICWCRMEKSHPIVRLLVGILISCAIGYGMTGAIVAEHNADRKAWNDGYCSICGNEMEFVNASHGRHGTVYYYWYCDKCGHTLELTSNFAKGETDNE